MDTNISPLFRNVNKRAIFTSDNYADSFQRMRYGQRLKNARGEKTQAWLSEKSGVSQSLISQLENSLTATGSEYTPRLARALEISVDWLADEIGEMKPSIYTTTDPAAINVLKAMEPAPEYLKASAIKAALEELSSADSGGRNEEAVLLRAFRLSEPPVRQAWIYQAEGILRNLDTPSQLPDQKPSAG